MSAHSGENCSEQKTLPQVCSHPRLRDFLSSLAVLDFPLPDSIGGGQPPLAPPPGPPGTGKDAATPPPHGDALAAVVTVTVLLFLIVFLLLLCLLRKTVGAITSSDGTVAATGGGGGKYDCDPPDNLILVYTSKMNLLEGAEQLQELCYEDDDIGKAV